ncbi:MAG: heparan-alpha-glucosaminide N-acetyltransferase domain-containing protein [Legionellaceae bacterium]|nr:heparan-alpha-glucosaminide N-acetyltransferase domain-containing protein [Legionellaceae bacterium]
MPTNPKRRYLSLDILKGIGMLYLVFLHQIVWILIKDDSGQLVFEQSYTFFYFFFHSIFGMLGFQVPLLAGITFFLDVRSRNCSWMYVGTRACIFIALGFLLNSLTWGLREIFAWDVLGFIGLSMMLTYPLLKRCNDKTSFSILLSVGAVTLMLSDAFIFPEWQDHFLYYVFMGDPQGETYWALCPWFAIFVWGLFIGKIFALQQNKYLVWLACGGVVMIMISVLSGHFFPPVHIENIWGPALFKPHPLFIVGILGFSSVLIPLLDIYLEHRVSLKQKLDKLFWVYIGRGGGTLWVYMLTIFIGYHLTVTIQNHVNLTYHSSLWVLSGLIFIQVCIAGAVGWWMQQKARIPATQ